MQFFDSKHWRLALLCICVFVTACHGQIITTPEADTVQSSLARALVKESDFTSDWRWLDSHASTESVTPSYQNHYLIEVAEHSVSGLYGYEQDFIVIMHRLKWHEQSVLPENLVMGDDPNLAEGQEFSIEVAPLGRYMESQCTEVSHTKVCRVVVQYDFITSGLTIYAPESLDKNDLGKIASEALIAVDGRIAEVGSYEEHSK